MQGIKRYLSPSVISRDNFRPDLLSILPINCLYILELTIGYEPNLSSNSIRKEKNYRQLLMEQRSQYKKCLFVNLSMEAFGVMSRSSISFLDMMKDLDFNEDTRKFIIKKLMNITIGSNIAYYIFCRRKNKDWLDRQLLTF